MGNGYPYPQNIWVGYGYDIAPMGNPMDILLVHDHLKFKPISLHFKILNAILIISTGYPSGIGYPMGMGMGANLCPWVLKWVGIEIFCGYGFG